MTLDGDDGYEETPSSALTPGVDGVDTPLQEAETEVEQGQPSSQPTKETQSWRRWYHKLEPLLGYLPTGVHEEDTDRDGLLSYSVEVHAAVIGGAVGATAATTGSTQLIIALVTIALGVGRVQQQFSETIRLQVLKEPWYAIGGVVGGYLAVYLAQSGQLPF